MVCEGWEIGVSVLSTLEIDVMCYIFNCCLKFESANIAQE